MNVVAPLAAAIKYTHYIMGPNPWKTNNHQPHYPAATHTAANDRQERAPDLVLKFFAQWEPPLHWVEVSYNYRFSVSTQHWSRCFKDIISCPWNNLHWVVGRAELLVAVDSGVCSLKIENSKLKTSRQGHRRGWSKTSGRNSIAPLFYCVIYFLA